MLPFYKQVPGQSALHFRLARAILSEENMNELNEVQEKTAEARYVGALQAGFKGSQEDYERILRENLGKAVEEEKPKPKPPLTEDEIIRTRWRQAGQAGYMGTLKEYRDLYTGIKAVKPKSVSEGEELVEPDLDNYKSIADGPDAQYLAENLQRALDEVLEKGWLLVDFSESTAIFTRADNLTEDGKGKEFFAQRYRTVLRDQGVSLEGEMIPIDVTMKK